MSRRDWWLGIVAIVIAVLLHAAFPRYNWRPLTGTQALIRIDRWTGSAVIGGWVEGQWVAAKPSPSPALSIQQVEPLPAK